MADGEQNTRIDKHMEELATAKMKTVAQPEACLPQDSQKCWKPRVTR